MLTPVPGEHPPPRNILTNLNLWPMREEKQKSGDGFQKQKTNKTSNCFLQYFFFYSCFFFLLLFYFFKTLKLESSVAPHTASFFRLAELYTLWNPAWMIQKIIIIATMRIYCMRGELYLVISVVVFRVSLFLVKMPFCFSFSLSSVWHSSLCTFIYTKIKWQKAIERLDSCCIYI